MAFIIPGMILMIALAWIAAAHGQVPWVAAVFAGVQPVVIALVIGAMRKIAGRALSGPFHWALAVAAFLALYFADIPFPVVVAVAAIAGLLLPGGDTDATVVEAGPNVLGHAFKVLGVTAILLFVLFFAVRTAMGGDPFDDVATLFTTAALVTFGGAYAVLPFVADQAVETYGWLGPADMLNGLAIAEATPGPLILVNTYAGYFAGWSTDATFIAGMTTALLATVYTFAPSFALILAFAPAVERLHSIPWARKALAGVSAAVVGVIANLAVYLAEAAFLPSGPDAPEWAKIALFVVAMIAVFVLRAGMITLVGGGILAGLVLYLTGVL